MTFYGYWNAIKFLMTDRVDVQWDWDTSVSTVMRDTGVCFYICMSKKPIKAEQLNERETQVRRWVMENWEPAWR